jgi:hypothetical protein
LNNFDMVRIYSIPTQSTDAKASLGMYYLDVVDPFGKPSRPTVSAYKILADLLIAKDKIGTTNTLAQGKATKAAVLRCYLEFIYISRR